MAERICLISGCDRHMEYPTKGFCRRHYDMARKVPAPNPAQRFESQISPGDNGCWEWTAHRDPKGYGMFNTGGKTIRAHRWSYEYHRATIPQGLVIDHLCRNRGCVNPWHMEPVTDAVNAARGYWGTRTTCIRGHEWTPETSRVRPDGYRWCRTCHRIRLRAERAKRKALAS